MRGVAVAILIYEALRGCTARTKFENAARAPSRQISVFEAKQLILYVRCVIDVAPFYSIFLECEISPVRPFFICVSPCPPWLMVTVVGELEHAHCRYSATSLRFLILTVELLFVSVKVDALSAVASTFAYCFDITYCHIVD